MPHPEHPPTPTSSTEIRGQDGSKSSSLQLSFELPPPGIAMEQRPSSGSTTKSSSASSYHPTSPSPKSPNIALSEVVKIRRRSSTAQAPAKDAFALPPPPTRSRKIIQMKPRGQPDETIEMVDEGPKAGKGTTGPSKKKQPSSTSVAGRKIARKTAHSLIERRRRSKMNEEFGVLKDMIPACTGEMHKLAILQASIDYVRYLEDCVSKLKAENNRNSSTSTAEQFMLPPAARQGSYSAPRQYHSYEEDEDVEMGGSDGPSPTNTTPTAHSHQPSLSPAMIPQDSKNRQNSYSSISSDPRRYSFSALTTTSPALLPGAYTSNPGSTLTSPALLPQRDIDQEATAALLMLNTDRRGTGSNRGGMSVKDLLSS